MARRRMHKLLNPRLRASWHKLNLYNLWRAREPRTQHRTFFQQKWSAKSVARAYHGEQIREKQWERQFSRYIPAVVPMNPSDLAKSDGSDLAAGRGSGVDLQGDHANENEGLNDREMARKEMKGRSHYMSGIYWPIERRLDQAIWRALFASSARQARQFVVHGFVKVNGQKMRYPGYLLNPGDLFSVDPEMVLYATGGQQRDLNPPKRVAAVPKGEDGEVDAAAAEAAEKLAEEAEARKEEKKAAQAAYRQHNEELQGLRDMIVESMALEGLDASGKDNQSKEAKRLTDLYNQTLQRDVPDDIKAKVEKAIEAMRQQVEANSLKEADIETSEGADSTATSKETVEARKKSLKQLRADIQQIITARKPSANRKKELRALHHDVTRSMSKARSFPDDSFLSDLCARFEAIEKKVAVREEGLNTLPDGRTVDAEGNTVADAEVEVEADILPSSEGQITSQTLISAIKSALQDPVTTLVQTRALRRLAHRAEFEVSADVATLSANLTAILGPERASSFIENAEPSTPLSKTQSSSGRQQQRYEDNTGFRKTTSEHLIRVRKLAEFQKTSRKPISNLPAFAKEWINSVTTSAQTAPTNLKNLTASLNNLLTPSPFSSQIQTTKSEPSNRQTPTAKPRPKTPHYLTPWRPRAYMPAFAYIPRYLEVNQNVCSAVYLRHPVVRPGLSEIPSPFSDGLAGLVFNWYLRRR